MSSVFTSMTGIFLRETTADVHFAFVNETPRVRVPAHKAILANSSPVFKQMFFGELPEKGDVKIEDASSSAFKYFLTYFYHIECEYSPENIAEIMYLASKYMVEKLKSGCEKYLMGLINKEKKSDFFAYELALQFDCQALQAKCREFIRKYIITFIRTDDFLECNRIVVVDIMKWNSGFFILQACMKWAQKTCEASGKDATNAENLRSAFREGWREIPFDQLSLEHFVIFEKKYPVFSFDEYKAIIDAIAKRQTPGAFARSGLSPCKRIHVGDQDDPIEVLDSEDEEDLRIHVKKERK